MSRCSPLWKINPLGWKPQCSCSNILTSMLVKEMSCLNILGSLKPKYVDVIIRPLTPFSFKFNSICFKTASPDSLIKATENSK